MRRIAHVSRTAGACSADVIEGIARQASHLNGLDGITGLLLFDGFMFMQAIEGPDTVTRNCFSRIKRDTRHQDVTVSADEAVKAKQFGAWSLLTLSPKAAGGAAYVQAVREAVASVTDVRLKAMFIGFASLRRR